MRNPEQCEVAPNLSNTSPTERGSQRWSWRRALHGAKYGLIFGVGLAGLSLGTSILVTDLSADIPGVARMLAFQVGYGTVIGGLIGGFKPTSELAVKRWRSFSSPFKHNFP